jgi:5'-deoxynucleotidase YfbR-like HD superfamily hydrolase
MDAGVIRQQILDSEQFVIEELRKVQTLYALKHVIRYNHERNHEADTESVAEHIFGMHCLVDYFLLLEDMGEEWDITKIRTMVQYHDSDEIETGDKVGYEKTEADRAAEASASLRVIKKLPEIMQATVTQAIAEYEAKTTPEARFVRAIDKIEPVFHLYNEAGKQTLARLKTTREQHESIKQPYVQEFPTIKRFTEVMSEQFAQDGFYQQAS